MVKKRYFLVLCMYQDVNSTDFRYKYANVCMTTYGEFVRRSDVVSTLAKKINNVPLGTIIVNFFEFTSEKDYNTYQDI